MHLAVLLPRGPFPEQAFPDGPGAPEEQAHPPVGGHGFAASTSGTFFRKEEVIPAWQKEVLLLLQNLKNARQAMIDLRRAGKTVALAFHDAGRDEIAALLAQPAALRLFHEICARADGAIATTQDLVPFFTAAGVRHTEFIPAPWPVDDARWDFGLPFEERRGILLGTRDFRAPARQHLAALLVARTLASSMFEQVTVLNEHGWRGRQMLARLGYDERLLRVVEGPLPFPRHLRLVARHKLVWQLDASAGAGRVAGAALLARVPCVGGHGATERLVFPELCGHGRGAEQLLDLTARLLDHPHDCAELMAGALEKARAALSFEAVARPLGEFFRRIAR